MNNELWGDLYCSGVFSSGTASPKIAQIFMRIRIIPAIKLLQVIIEMLENPRSQGEIKIHIPMTS